ncbi:MAG: class II fructose-bisphosphate aldolase [Anaerolineae bacterium]
MPLVNLKPWLRRAQQQHFAIGAFNANTLEQAQAVAMAAEAEAAPAFIQISHNAAIYAGRGNALLGLRFMASIGCVAASSVRVPIALHLDHATAEEVQQALALGFTSVMFDGGDLPFEQNMQATYKLAGIAHMAGASIEGEIGDVPKRDSSGRMAPAILTEPQEAADYARASGIDVLAIAIGSAHGGRTKEVELDLERLKAIRQLVSLPLALHGSSGVTDDSLARAIQAGIVKVNLATQLNQAFTRGVRASLEDSSICDPRQYLGPARDEMIEQVRERIRFFGSDGQA